MTKQGYQKRLPAILPPPTTSAPRVSHESVEATRPEIPPVVAAGRPRRSRASVAMITVFALVSLVAIGFLVFSIMGLLTGPSPPSGLASPTGDTGPVLGADESYVETRVLPSGTLVVHQWIRPSEPLRQLRLTLPSVPGPEHLSATEVEVLADSVPVDGPGRIGEVGATYTFEESMAVEVRYRLTGAVERSDSTAGRALAIATTLHVDYRPQARLQTQVVRAGEVLSLACSPSPTQTPVPCGEPQTASRWRVDLTGSSVVDRVIAQVTLD